MSPAIRARIAGRGSVPQLIFGDLWEYDPAPETADPKLKPRYDLFINGKFVAPKSRQVFRLDQSRQRAEALAEIALGESRPMWTRRIRRRRRRSITSWGKMPGRERGKYIYRIARLLQDRAREFAVAETMDGGKPIKESRDFDVPMAAAHFFYHAGWADKLEYVAPGPPRRAARRGRAGDPVEFSAADAGVEDSRRRWRWETRVVLKPAETTIITALKFAEILQEAELPPGVVNIVSRRGRDGRGGDGASARGEGRVHRLDRGRARSSCGSLAGTDKKMTMELGGKAANIVFDDAPIDQAVEGIVNGIFFNQGHVCCAGSRLLVQEIDRRECS